MNECDFLSFFKGVLETNESDIEMETEFRYLDDWSSLAGVSFLAEVKAKFGKTIQICDFKSAETIADLYKLIQ